MKKYCDSNLNYYIKIKLTEEGRIIYKKHYAKYNCEAPKLNIDDEGYVQFQIHDFMNIFGERLFMGATLPCETNCKIQVKDEWHYPSKGELPKCDEEAQLIFYVNCYYEVGGETLTKKRMVLGYYKKSFLRDDVKLFVEKSKGYEDEHLPQAVIAWKEIVLPKESEIESEMFPEITLPKGSAEFVDKVIADAEKKLKESE